MSEAKTSLDLSLDDLIKKQASKAKPKGGGGGRQGGPSRGPGKGRQLGVEKGRGGGVTKASARPGKQAPLASDPGRRGPGGRGGVITVRNPVAGRGPRNGPAPLPAPGGFRGRRSGPPMDAPPPGKWRHDLYDPTVGETRPVAISGGSGSVIKNKLFVSNLDHNVTDADLEELFRELGSIKEAGVHYDKSGRSKGTAHVVFEHARDAQAAFTKYNNVALDGKRLNIELVETTVPPGTFTRLSSGINVSTVADDPPPGFRGRGFGSNRPRSFVRGRGAPRDGGDADVMQE